MQFFHENSQILDEFVTFFVKLKRKFSLQPFLKEAEVGRLGEIHLNDSKVGYNEFDFFYKIKITDPLMGANLRHIYNIRLGFLSRFLRVWLQSFQKVLK
jgi:hypothetical protein